MPKIKAKIIKTKNADGKLMALIQCNEKLPNVGDTVSLKWGSIRSLSQNSLWWAYLTWCINEGGLKEHGHFFPESLHDNLKKHLLSSEKKDDATTTDLTKMEFSEFFEKADLFIQEFFEISTAPFWDNKEKNYN